MTKHPYKISNTDKKSLAFAKQLNYKEQEDFVSSVFLGFKFCFLLLAIVSLIKIGYTSKVRLNRLQEIKNSFLYEKSRFKVLSEDLMI